MRGCCYDSSELASKRWAWLYELRLTEKFSLFPQGRKKGQIKQTYIFVYFNLMSILMAKRKPFPKTLDE